MKKSIKLLFVYSLIFILAFSNLSGFQGVKADHSSPQLTTFHLEVDETSSEVITVIVELQEESIVESKHIGKNHTKNHLAKARNLVINEIQSATSSSNINQEYEYVFSGFSLELPQNELYKLVDIDGIKAVYPNQEYEAVSISEDDIFTSQSITPEMLETAPFIQSEQAWDAGYTGEGVTVAIIDTGVDYTHPDLVNNFEEYKGWDFVDNNDSPQETPVGDPRGDATTHGTHVAGTVAANGNIKGVAPEATLLAYRVLGPGGSGSTENVVAAIERAVLDGADVMNLSLGNTSNDPDFPTSIALDWAMAEGVVAVTSNGNSGPNNWTVGSPGTSREAISVGASQLPYNFYTAEIFTSPGADYPSAKVMGYPNEEELLALNEGEFEFVDVGLAGTDEDFEGKDLEGKIALIQRGDYPFVEKAENAKEHGAIGAVIYNNVEGEQPEVAGLAIPSIMTTLEDGEVLLAELAAGNNTISFNIEFDRLIGETIADFSSRGPVMNTWMIKPDVAAPGVAILSTVPTHNPDNPHGYASTQGTSMAAPHVAGAAALILQANPDWSVEFVKSALMNTAENLYDFDGNLYPHNTQGAGSIRVFDAINTNTVVTPGSHSFGIFSKEKGKEVQRQSFTIHNLSNERKRYSLEFTGHEGIKIQTSRNLQVQPGRTQNINFGVQVDASKLEPGYYEGTFILSDGEQSVEVPTILFVQEPDYPMLSGLSLGIAGENLVGTVNVPGGAEVFNLRIRNADTGELLAEPAKATNVPQGLHSFSWNMTINGEPLVPGRYQINVYARTGTNEYELQGGVLTIQ
ncbi:S8 family serine peptidase [Evansella cellulosilytica]|uniref:Peptidase S8 and S53 subtilisin kexin sedolisin n=1 Tax=Evansella cellulosilytica (strain ATCC 21833 / DSM 2522 / FERM P-1141 / JCM 9156 / N-4) TaxID=649639 RepID=E6TQS1_EVAC2|nr:S8 family serine peptidase [Evansella cellulosilytica]ADU31696.1 peptidase S8 and S53 subtilisin kexin sedolisin [Evansella cellulosilytica DSM 2522]